MRRRGSTLIDCMIALVVLGIGASLMVGPFSGYHRASERAAAAEGLVRALDQELERARACRDRACIDAIVTSTTTVTAGPGADWVRAEIRRTIEPGPSGTVKLTVIGSVPKLVRERRIAALLWVGR